MLFTGFIEIIDIKQVLMKSNQTFPVCINMFGYNSLTLKSINDYELILNLWRINMSINQQRFIMEYDMLRVMTVNVNAKYFNTQYGLNRKKQV